MNGSPAASARTLLQQRADHDSCGCQCTARCVAPFVDVEKPWFGPVNDNRFSRHIHRQSIKAGGPNSATANANQLGHLLRQISDAMLSFYSPTTFTESEFGRTLERSGTGSDHGWGNHHIVLGGALKGGDIYGNFPVMALGGPDNSASRGAWIPSTSTDQFGAIPCE